MKMDRNNYCVIMAGGIGSRFWPISKTETPKQFLDVLGVGKSLLQLTYERFKNICADENFIIVTNKIYKKQVLDQLPVLNEDQVLLEPKRRNTAPCIAYANRVIREKNPNAKIVVAPSDHIVLKEVEFLNIISSGLDFVEKNNALLTLGITPTRPDTGYGYIQGNVKEQVLDDVYKVKTFTEKPNAEIAKFFYESGEFFWNSGIFLWSLDSIDKAFKEHLPEVSKLFTANTSLDESEFIKLTYDNCPNISIDYGVMEKAKNVFVYKSEFGWSDLGTWGSLFENKEKTKDNNAIINNNVLSYDSNNNIIYIPKDKIAVIQGLKDMIIVDSGESILICKKDEEQRIKQFVNDVKSEKGEDFI